MKHLDKPGPGHTGPCQHVELVKLLGLGLGEVHGKAAGGDEGQVVELAEPGHRGQSIVAGGTEEDIHRLSSEQEVRKYLEKR